MAVSEVATERERNSSAIRKAVTALTAAFGNRVVTSQAVREQHGNTVTWIANQPPDAVVYPQSTEEVQQIVRICSENGVAIIPFGVGTSLEGHVNAPVGGVSIDFRDMNRVLAVHAEDLDCIVEPGITRKALNEQLRDSGLFFPIDPGADASLGGMAATRCSGTNAVRYGTMKDNVLALKVVLANGEVIDTARRAKKTSAGYDLTRLMVGSEGTLGVITEATLRTYGIPEAISAAVSRFTDLGGAVRAATAVLQLGVPVARIELVDELAIDAINSFAGLDYPVAPLLLFEFHGSAAGVSEQAGAVAEIVAEHGGRDFRSAIDAQGRAELWRARHQSFYASLALRPGARSLTTDVCVPISRLATCIEETQRDIHSLALTASIVGHVGDGNFHVTFLIDPDDPDELARARDVNRKMVARAIELGGTCTGEHGVGYGKAEFLASEHGEALQVMAAIKQTLDPAGIMNPGKMVDAALEGIAAEKR